jgi:group II intron reverse transcriptase/maturase
MRFTALMHHICEPAALLEAYHSLERNAAAGVDGETWRHYGQSLEENIQDLAGRLKRGGYRAKPVKRAYIPKADGKQRPLGIAALEDKIVQVATVRVLNAIYETDFLGFSYGFRPGRSAHNALDAVYAALLRRRVDWILDADIRGFFDGISHEWLVKFVEHRVGDKRVIRLIQKWLKAGVLEDGKWRRTEEGTPQGASISPLLANIFLHYVLDLWVHHWRRTRARGDVIIVRYADDFVVGFMYKWEAEAFWKDLKERFLKFRLELHPEKTRLLEFGRYAAERREKRGEGRPEVFNFLGLTHISAKDEKGKFMVLRITQKKRFQAKLREVKGELRRRMHDSIPDLGKWLRMVVYGHIRYYGVRTNRGALYAFRFNVGRLWYQTLRRRSQRARLTWERMERLIEQWLPPAYPSDVDPLNRIGVMT